MTNTNDYPKTLYTTESRQVVALSQDFDPSMMTQTQADISRDGIMLIRSRRGGTTREFELNVEELAALCAAWTDFCYQQNTLTEEQEEEIAAVQDAYDLAQRVPGFSIVPSTDGRYAIYNSDRPYIRGLKGDELLEAIRAIVMPVEA